MNVIPSALLVRKLKKKIKNSKNPSTATLTIQRVTKTIHWILTKKKLKNADTEVRGTEQ